MSTSRVMLWVLAALTPGAATLVFFYGSGYLSNLVIAVTAAWLMEALCLGLRRQPLACLTDLSATVTAVLLALALPPGSPWGIIVIAVATAIGLAKHLYGGLGHNLFNPAIVGYAVVLVSFPAALALWPQPTDGLTGATALVSLRHREGLTITEVWQASRGFGSLGGYAWEWINAAFLAGGLLLCARGLAAWRVPAAMLATLSLLAALSYDSGSSASAGSPLFHAFSGGTLFAAFFFATDPVSHPVSARGQVIFGCIIGAMTFAVRGYGNYPDGIAFGILLANALTPYLDKRLATVDA